MIASKNVLSVLMILAASGCVSPQEELGVESRAVIITNSFSPTSLSATSTMLLDMAANPLLVPNTSTLNLQLTSISDDQLAMLEYTVRCALGPSDVVDLTVAGVPYQFYGGLNMAGDWKKNALSNVALQESLSGCLLSHVNFFHVPVHLSMRATGLTASQDELTRYVAYEGAFYGNVFDPSQPTYTCSGDAAPDFTVSYPNHDTTAGDRLLRRCTDVETGGGTVTMCGFEYVGACSAVCDTATADGYAGCWSDAARTQTRYDAPMNAWHLPFDDTESTWSIYYDQAYGQ